jgi:hypothetical protein
VSDDEVAELIGDPLVRARRGVIGGIGGPDQSKADELGQLAHGLEQGPAARAQITDLADSARPVQAGAAGLAFEMGHPARFASMSSVPQQVTIESRNRSLAYVSGDGTSTWSFLTNHARVLVCIAQDPGIRLRELGDRVGITERAAHRIVDDLAAAGYLVRERRGRRNHYMIEADLPVPDPLARRQKIGDLLDVLSRP